MAPKSLAGRIPAPLIFVSSGVIQYSGAAFAVSLFAVMSPSVVVWWRMVVGAVALLLMWRPWKLTWTRKDLLASMLFGLILGTMNVLFYESISRIPLGVAVSIEFVGPVAVAVWRGRGATTRIAALLAFLGILSIGGWGIDLRDPGVLTGVLFVLGAAVMWAAYIVLGQRIASQRSGVGSLSVGMTAAAIVYAPILAPPSFNVDFTWAIVGTLIGVGVLSTAIPYSLEAVALKRLSSPVFALLTSLLPATSTLVGAILLTQLPSLAELIGLVLVSSAVWMASRVE